MCTAVRAYACVGYTHRQQPQPQQAFSESKQNTEGRASTAAAASTDKQSSERAPGGCSTQQISV